MCVELHGKCWQLAHNILVVGIIPSPLSPKNRQNGGAPGKILSLSLARGGCGGWGWLHRAKHVPCVRRWAKPFSPSGPWGRQLGEKMGNWSTLHNLLQILFFEF